MGPITNYLKKMSLKRQSYSSGKTPFLDMFRTFRAGRFYFTNKYNKLDKYLQKKSVYKSVKFRENNGFSLLHQSVLDSNLDVLGLILSKPYAKDDDVIHDNDNQMNLSPVHLAGASDNVDILDIFNQLEVDMKKTSKTEELNLVHVCSYSGSVKALNWSLYNIFNENYKSWINSLSSEKWTPLHYACYHNKMDVTSYLIDIGADLYSRNNQHLTPIDLAVFKDNFELFKCLYNHHYSKDRLAEFDDEQASKLVHIAATSLSGTKCLDYLLDDPSNVNLICNTKLLGTPLHFACMSNNLAGVKSLIRKGASLNVTDHLGNTPIIYATEVKNLEIMRQLDENGADGNIKNKEGLSACYLGINSDEKEVKFFYLGNLKYRNSTLI